MCFGCLPVMGKDLSEIEVKRRAAANYAQIFGVDVVLVKMNGELSFHIEAPEGSEVIEHITRHYSTFRV